MDNLTHSLTGLALARAGLDRFSPNATLLLLISANLPDIDIVALSQGQLRYLEIHRGYTHSLLFLPLMAFASLLIVAAICRRKLPWFRAWLLCTISIASHLLLDWTNSYGIRLLLPFSSRWFHLDLNSLTDFVVLGVLCFAALWPLLSRLVAAEIGVDILRYFRFRPGLSPCESRRPIEFASLRSGSGSAGSGPAECGRSVRLARNCGEPESLSGIRGAYLWRDQSCKRRSVLQARGYCSPCSSHAN